MAQPTNIPNEILLLFFSHLPLKALIAARGVDRRWKQLVPNADILPARRSLLNLYLRVLASPLFIPTRPWVLSRLQPFDRKGYLDTLLQEHQYLPEDFCLWVLEWPARAAIRRSWPGLPVCAPAGSMVNDLENISGYNWLGTLPPRLSAMSFGRLPYGSMPALCLWVGNGEATWLSLDQRDGLRGKVYELYTDGYWQAPKNGLDVDKLYANFIEWQTWLWERVERKAAYASSYSPEKLDAGESRGVRLLVHGERKMVSYPVLPTYDQLQSMKSDSVCF